VSASGLRRRSNATNPGPPETLGRADRSAAGFATAASTLSAMNPLVLAVPLRALASDFTISIRRRAQRANEHIAPGLQTFFERARYRYPDMPNAPLPVQAEAAAQQYAQTFGVGGLHPSSANLTAFVWIRHGRHGSLRAGRDASGNNAHQHGGMRRMTAATEAVRRYRALPPDAGDDDEVRIELLQALESYANDAEVGALLGEILRARGEYDLARIEAIKIVHLYVDETSPLEQALKRAVWDLFADRSEDALVRQHASQNLDAGFGGDQERAVVERVLFDDGDDLDVRHGAFRYLRGVTDAAFVRQMLPRLRGHAHWSRYRDALERLATA